MKIPTICRYCGGKIIKTTTRALYPKGNEPIYLCTLERMCNDPLQDKLDGILFAAAESYGEFESATNAPAARRIGKLRDEFLRLYEDLSQYKAAAQTDGERQKIDACLAELEQRSQQAHAAVSFSYVGLPELYELKAS